MNEGYLLIRKGAMKMKFAIVFTVLSFIGTILSVYLICRLPVEADRKGNCRNISVVVVVVLVLQILITIRIHRRIHSTTTTIICLIIAVVAATVAIILAKCIQNKLARRINNDRS